MRAWFPLRECRFKSCPRQFSFLVRIIDVEPNSDEVISAIRGWIESIVIDLNLCPFAQRVFAGDLIRYTVCDAADEIALLDHLTVELEALADPSARHETTLLIHPRTLVDFLDYNDFLAVADRRLEQLGYRGVIQIASFHPQYQFAGTEPDAVENYTNRSPWPMLHLLREDSITKVANDPEELAAIPERNIRTLRTLGLAGILQRLRR